jgi:hypothetical protein
MTAPATTDPQRRLALQLAIQLPQDHAEAREVLDLTGELLDGFMRERSSAQRRALKLGWGIVKRLPAPSCGRPRWLTACCVLGCALLALTASTLAGLALFAEFHMGAIMSYAVCVTLVALVLGTWPALAVSAGAALLFNWLVVPPLWQLTAPSAPEVIALAGYVLLSLIVPWIAERRLQFRAAVVPALRLVEADEGDRAPISAQA